MPTMPPLPVPDPIRSQTRWVRKSGPMHRLRVSGRVQCVVHQPYGHWGVQIYANHKRIWPATFGSEKEAAMVYDSAAIKLRNGSHSHRNFPWTETTIREPKFQSHFNRERYHVGTVNGNPLSINLRQLFQKEPTPSDVGKLNRIVIPKKYALKYFPRINSVVGNNGGGVDAMELVFFDRSMRSWKFRYCYWKSSQSYVFTRGWSGFVKEKGLRNKDRVIFSSYHDEEVDGTKEVQKVFIIDVAYNDGATAERERHETDLVCNFAVNVNEIEKDTDDTKEVQKVFIIDVAYNDGAMVERERHETYLVCDFALNVNENEKDIGIGDQEKGFKIFGMQII
ncbi:hypothetical protein BUALT_Bualt16G0086300 [Buddleja alternifolia]|uniref:AP2/ERF and B3 domain-containing transcription factor n=1 Tax=Buddleja alternifolia TaxID=168488 RepID=A0AAV6WHX0_9LAMI|nr:hypothetical protein BUALT_Bualt16G0086300 [Buddleja alternifolia]